MELRVFNPAAFGSQGALGLVSLSWAFSPDKYVLFDLSQINMSDLLASSAYFRAALTELEK